jgi:hypothetical protein
MRLLAAFGLLCAALLARPALAQTTTFVNGTSCPAGNWSISGGGTTLTGIATPGVNSLSCLANVGKLAGKWYYTVVVSQLGGAVGVGVSSASGTGTMGALNDLVDAGYDMVGGGIASPSYLVRWNGAPSGTAMPYTLNATMGVAVDMDGPFTYIWVTADINGTSGCGGGPLWNGDPNASPVVIGSCGGRGTGIPNGNAPVSTGVQFGMTMHTVYPSIAGGSYYGGATPIAAFNFASNSTLNTLLGAGGFQGWNINGGQTAWNANDMVTATVANAPGWQASHHYDPGDRVIAGPGWSGGSYTSGSPVYLWGLSSAGGNSSGSGNGPQSCPSPTGYGGGFATGPPAAWTGHTTVSDAGLTWVCLTQVDYITIHDANLDSPPWQAGHLYQGAQYALANNHAFEINNNNPCTSGSTPPPPGGGSDGGCTWTDRGTVTYSSQSNYISHRVVTTSGSGVITYLNTNSIIFAYGGLASQTYSAGANGEDNPPTLSDHTCCYTAGGESPVYCPDYIVNFGQGQGGCGFNFYIQFKTFPGDSAGESFAATGGPITGPDPTKGVMFSNTLAGPLALAYQGLDYVNVDGPQFYSQNGTAFGGSSDIPYAGFWIYGSLKNVIVEGGGYAAVGLGTGDITNSIIIYTGTQPYGTAWYERFPGHLINSILIGPGTSACSTCFARALGKPNYPTNNGNVESNTTGSHVQNSWESGFAYPLTYSSDSSGVPIFGPVTGANNATDIPSSYVPPYIPATSVPWGGYGGLAFQFPGTTSSTQGLNPADVFVSASPPYDFRLKSGSPLIGAGSMVVTNTWPGIVNVPSIPTTDLLGNARPTAGRADVGAAQYQGAPPVQTIDSIAINGSTTTGSFTPGGTATVGTVTTAMSPVSPPFTGTTVLGTGSGCPGTNNASFSLSGSTLQTTAGVGTYAISLVATQAGISNSPYCQNFTITGSTSPAPPVITSAGTASGTVGISFSYQITATNSPTSWGASGLPSPLTVNTSTGAITGTPIAASTTTATISATNAGGTGTSPLVITIAPPAAIVGGRVGFWRH